MKNSTPALALSTRALRLPRLAARWQQTGQSAIAKLRQAVLNATVNAHEPRIRLTRDAHGQPLWQVFDPISRTHATFARERDVRVWLEQRYNQ